MPSTARHPCPTCRKPVPSEANSRTADFPFCSRRCRLVDLGRWLDGTYRIPVAPGLTEEEESELQRAERDPAESRSQEGDDVA